MQTRRSFMGAMAAGVVALFAGETLATEEFTDRRYWVKMNAHRIPGVNYFLAHHPTEQRRYDLPAGKMIYFNGEDWTNRSFEADLSEGWIKAYVIGPDGKFIVDYGPDRTEDGWQKRQRLPDGTIRPLDKRYPITLTKTYHGRIEVR